MDVVTQHRVRRRLLAQQHALGVIDGHSQVGRRCHRLHPEGGVTHQRHMDPFGAVAGGITRFVVLGNARAEPDGFAQTHVMKFPVRSARPSTGEGVGGGGQLDAQKIIRRVPITKIAAEEHGENDALVVGDQLRGFSHAARAGVSATTAAVAPQVTLRGESGQPIARNGVDGTHERGEVAPAIQGKRFAAKSAEIIINQSARFGGDESMTEGVVLIQILTEQLSFTEGKSWQVREVNPARLQIHPRRVADRVKLAIARHVPMAQIAGGGGVDRGIGLSAGRFAVEHVGRPGAFVLRMAVGVLITGIRHRHMTNRKTALTLEGSAL